MIDRLFFLAMILMLPLIGGCASNPLIADGKGGRYKVGGTYKVKGVKYHARVNLNYIETGIASWYGRDFHGKKTANGEIYNMHQLTAAHKTLPMPTYVRVTNLKNDRSAVLRVNDRGPYKSDHGTDTRNRIIDVSRKAAQLLGFLRAGMAPVEVRYLGRARPADEGKIAKNIKRRRVPGQWRPVGETSRNKAYHLKIGAFGIQAHAERHRRRIARENLGPSRLRKEKNRWVIIFGPFEDKNEAHAVRSILMARGYRKTFILTEKMRRRPNRI